MVELMYKFKVLNILSAAEHEIDEEKCLLWVWHADKIPPHLGISTKGKYFSLKANGKDVSIDIESVRQIIERKKIKTLCFELINEVAIKEVEDSFGQYVKTIPYITTCLHPIQEIVNSPASKQLVDLLVDLEEKHQIIRVFGFNIPAEFDAISEYTVDDIHARLLQLKDK